MRCTCSLDFVGSTFNESPYSVPGINAVPHEDNLRYFDVTIHGPSQSPYEGTRPLGRHRSNLPVPDTFIGGIFRLELFLPDDYPMTPPKIRFLTKIYHPNIDKLGRICLDVLKSKPGGLSFPLQRANLGRQLVPGSSNSDHSVIDTSFVRRTESRRSLSQ